MILKRMNYDTPLMVEYGITPFCNANCVFCLNYWQKNPFVFKESWEKTKKICDNIISADVFEVYLTGGEPTCSKFFDKIVKYFYNAGISVAVSTNGLNVTDDKLNSILYYVDKIGISLHSVFGAHDKIMNHPGAFNKVDGFLKKLDSVGYEYSLNYTTFLGNYANLDSTLEFVNQNYVGVSGFNINRVSVVGKAFMDHIILPKSKQIELFHKIKSLKNRYYFDVDLADVGPYCFTKIKHKPCGAGFSFTYVDPWGNNQLCIMNNVSFGNLLETDLAKLWHNKEILKFRSLEWLPPKCKSCKSVSFCQGGCKFSQSELKSGVPYSEDILLGDYLK